MVVGGLTIGGLGVLAVRPVVRVLGPLVGQGPSAAVVLVACATLPAIIALAVVGPAVTRAVLNEVAGAGRIIGSLAAAGTVGSLVGTFAAGFVLGALFPVGVILFVCAGACLLLAILMATKRPRRKVAITATTAALLGTLLTWVPGRCDVETTYYCANVEGGVLPTERILVLDDLRHSFVDLSDPRRLEFGYTRRFADAIDTGLPGAEAVDAVHLGGGGFTMPRWLAATRPGTRSTVLELDKGVVELGRRELGVDEISGVTTRIGDARASLAALPDRSADLVIGDAFGARSVPWHLATTEFVADVSRVMRPGGLYVLNVIDQYPHSLLWSVTATVSTKFSQVAVLVRPDQLGRRQGGNAVVVATNGALDLAQLEARAAARGEPGSVLGGREIFPRIAGHEVLTDDHAPTDQLAARGRLG